MLMGVPLHNAGLQIIKINNLCILSTTHKTTTTMLRKVLLLPLLGLLVLTSCIKDFDDLPAPVPEDLTDIKVSSSFDWSTSKTIDVNITGLPTSIPIYSTLTISLSDGSSLFQSNHEMSQSVKLQVVIPALEEAVKIRYGSVEYLLPVQENKVDFSFIPEISE